MSKRGMDFSLDEALQILERTPAVLREWLEGLSDPWIERNEGGDTFSPRDVLGHLIHGEKTDWIPRLRQIMEGRGDRPFEPFDRFAMRKEKGDQRISAMLEVFTSLREENLNTLRAMRLSGDDMDRTGIHPDIGVVTVRQLLATWTAHDLAHLAQIARTMAKQYSDAVGPWRGHLRVMERS